MEIVKYSIRKKEMTASVMCVRAKRRGAPYADAQHNIGAVTTIMADALLKDTTYEQEHNTI